MNNKIIISDFVKFISYVFRPFNIASLSTLVSKINCRFNKIHTDTLKHVKLFLDSIFGFKLSISFWLVIFSL